MRGILIPTDGPPREYEFDGYQSLRAAVGDGDIEALDVGRADATAYGNEEAKMVNREVCARCGADWKPWTGASGTYCPECETDEEPSCTTSEWVEGMAPNPIATALIYGPGGNEERARRRDDGIAVAEEFYDFVVKVDTGDPREPYVAGPLLVTGFDGRTGENRDIPADLAELLLTNAPEGGS